MTDSTTNAASEIYTIRLARQADIPHLGAVERSAGQLFRSVGLDSIADDDPIPAEVLDSFLVAGNLWVVVVAAAAAATATSSQEDEAEVGVVVAFLAAFPITRSVAEAGQFLHIAELSVDAAHQRRGLASRLLRHFQSEAQQRAEQGGHVVGLSLTTYRHLEFNGPFYAKFGFVEIPRAKIEEVVGRRGRELWNEEQEKIVMPHERCWMIKWLSC